MTASVNPVLWHSLRPEFLRSNHQDQPDGLGVYPIGTRTTKEYHVNSTASPTLLEILVNKAASLTLLVAGIALVIFGILAMDSLASSFSKFFTGSPSDKSMWMLIVGVVLISVSGFGLFRGSKESA